MSTKIKQEVDLSDYIHPPHPYVSHIEFLFEWSSGLHTTFSRDAYEGLKSYMKRQMPEYRDQVLLSALHYRSTLTDTVDEFDWWAGVVFGFVGKELRVKYVAPPPEPISQELLDYANKIAYRLEPITIPVTQKPFPPLTIEGDYRENN